MTELEALKATVVAHLELHSRLPASLALRLLEAVEALERQVTVPLVSKPFRPEARQ